MIHVSRNRWIELTEKNPDHSTWYVERFRSMAAAGNDLAPHRVGAGHMTAQRSERGGRLREVERDVVRVEATRRWRDQCAERSRLDQLVQVDGENLADY